MTSDGTYLSRKVRRIEYERGVRRIIDSTETRNHISTLMGAGWSLRAIAGAADVSPQSVHRLSTGRESVHRDTAAAVLAIAVDSLPVVASAGTTEPFVSRIGTVRRIQALLFMGWSHAEITARADGLRSAVLLHQQGRWVTRTSHDKIATVYDEFWSRPGPSTKATAFATRLGYAGPLAWDDIDHDPEPVGAPDETWGQASVDDVVVQRVLDGQPRPRKLTAAEAAEIYRCARARGETTYEIEARYGLKSDRYVPVRRREEAS